MNIFAPIQQLTDLITFQWLGVPQSSYLGNAVNFFIFDGIKIGLLLVVITHIMAVTRYYFPVEKVRSILSQRRWYGLEYVLAALLGVVTPFCSCSSIPLFVGFLSAGIPLGVTFTFLISSPLVNESSLYVFPAIIGVKNTLLYNLLGVAGSVLGGMIIQKLRFERYIQPEFLHYVTKKRLETRYENAHVPLKDLLKFWSDDARDTTKKIFPYVFLGIGVGAIIHGFVPESLVTQYLSKKEWWTIPAAVLLGAPLYANSVSVIPIVEAMLQKGTPLGTALAFMTATVTISLPEGLMLAKLMKKPLLIAFFGVTVTVIMLMGYLFNFL